MVVMEEREVLMSEGERARHVDVNLSARARLPAVHVYVHRLIFLEERKVQFDFTNYCLVLVVHCTYTTSLYFIFQICALLFNLSN